MAEVDRYRTQRSYPAAFASQGNSPAVAAFVLGIVGVLTLFLPLVGLGGLVCGVLAVIFGISGWRSANRGASNKGLAISGFVLGLIPLVLAIVLVMFFFVVPFYGLPFLNQTSPAVP